MKHALLAIMIATATPSYAQELQCGGTADVYAELTEKYGEARKVWAQNGPAQVVEFWAGDKGWTIIITQSDGQSCMVGEGIEWGMMPSDGGPQL